MSIVFNNKDEVIENYLQEYKVSEAKVETYYHNQDKMKLFCIRMARVKGTETLKYYRVTRAGKYHLYLD